MVPSLLARLRLAPPSPSRPLYLLRRSLSAATSPPPESPPPPAKSKLFVAGLSWAVDERSLVDAFSSFGTVSEGGVVHRRDQCEGMSHGDVVAYSAAIHQSARAGLFRASVDLFVDMLRLGICPNSFTLVGVLLAASGLGGLGLAETVHGRAVKSRVESNPFVGTALLDCYGKCGCPGRAWVLFGEMRGPSVVTWNAMISVFVRNSLFEEALLMFKRLLHVFGPVQNVVTMISVAQGCTGYGVLGLCETAHAYATKNGLDLNVQVTNLILGMYLSFRNLEFARVVFRKMALTDVVTWTIMMGFLLEHARADEVVGLFAEMRSKEIEPDMVALVSLVQACALLGDVSTGKLAHNQIAIRGFSKDLPAANSLITMYSKCGDICIARMLFDHIREKSLISWTAIVSGYLEIGNAIEGMGLFSKMRREGKFVMDSAMMVTLLVACYELAKFHLCAQFHAYSYKSGLYLTRPVCNTLIAVYGKCGHVILARKMFDEIICLDVVSWNAMILSYGINGEGEEAVKLFNAMENSGEEGDEVTYLNTLCACSHSGLVDNGLMVFGKMVNEKGFNPSQEHIGCMVDMLARAGRLEEARKMASSTQDDKELNAWQALLGGCHLHGDMELTTAAAEKVLKIQSCDFGHMVLLSNAYASLGKFRAAESIRCCPTKKIAKKTLGLSSIEVMPSSTR